MQNRFFLISVLFLIILYGCNSENKTKENVKPEFISQSIMIDDAEIPFQYDSIAILLNKLGLCSLIDSVKKDTLPPCDYHLFRYFANNEEPLKKGFLVEIKPRIWSQFFLVANIAVNESGEYYKSNAFHGQLLELKTTKSGPYDMIIRYLDAEVGTVAILHKWNKTKYDPIEVLEINDHFIKPEKKDSINQVYLKDFVWGY